MNNLNEPAFPTESAAQTGNSTWRHEGMYLRDYFAAKAMHQFLTEAVIPPDSDEGEVNRLFEYVGKLSYKVADAMLKARKETY